MEALTWQEMYDQLLTQIRERFPKLPDNPTAPQLVKAIRALERDGDDIWHRNLSPERSGCRLFAFGPRDILSWAVREGLLSPTP